MTIIKVLLTLQVVGFGLCFDYSHDDPSDLLADVDETNFNSFIKESEYVFLDFYVASKDMAIPNDPETSLSSFFVAERLKDLKLIKFGKVETKKNEYLAKIFEVQPTSFPTKVLLRNGEIVAKISISQDMFNLYQPDTLEKWLLKRVNDPVQYIATDKIESVAEEQAIILILRDTIPKMISEISLNMTDTMFYKHDSDFTFGSRTLTKGGAYVIRNFIGATNTEPINLEQSKEELRTEMVKLTTPYVVEMDNKVFSTVQMKGVWMLVLGISKSVHTDVLAVFAEAMKQLHGSLDSEVRGAFIDMDKIDEDDRSDPLLRKKEFFGFETVPSIYVFKREEDDIIKDKMQTEITEQNIKTFLFEQIYAKHANKKIESQKKSERAQQPKTATPIADWKEKKIKPLVGSTIKEWVDKNSRSVMLVVCYEKPTPSVTKMLLSLNKLEKKHNNEVDFGKINTEENETEFQVPQNGVVVIRKRNKEVSTEILMTTLNVVEIASVFASKVLSKKDEL